VLLVDDDEAEVVHRGEHRGAWADGDPRLAGAQPPPLVVALPLPQRRVQQRHGVAEAGLEARDRLRGERDLRDEHDHALAALQRRGGGTQVDLRLPRPGDAVEQPRPAVVDGGDGGGLLGGQHDVRVGAGHGERHAAARPRRYRDEPARLQPPQRGEVAAGGARQRLEQRPLAVREAHPVERCVRARRPQLGPCPSARREHERQRARRGGAVLVGHPQGERDELGGHGVRADLAGREQPLRRELALRRHRHHDAVERLAPERDPHDRPDLEREPVRGVVERPRQPARGGERLDAGDHER
jgi:hypothetical protein